VGPLPTATVLTSAESTLYTTGFTAGVQNALNHTRPRIVTANGIEFVAFYGASGTIVLGKLDPAVGIWQFHDTGFLIERPGEVHEVPTIGVDSAGFVHLIWGTGPPNAFHYASSTAAFDINLMVQRDSHQIYSGTNLIYPSFVRAGNDLYVTYIHQTTPANANLYIKRLNTALDPALETWSSPVSASPAGLLLYGKDNAPPPLGTQTYHGEYYSATGARDGSLHIVWTWVPSGGSDSAQDLSYLSSHDRGASWQTKDGLTVVGGTAGGNINYQGSATARLLPGLSVNCINPVDTDASGVVHVLYVRPDSGVSTPGTKTIWNYHHLWISAGVVHDTQISNFTTVAGHPCADPELSGPELLTSGDTVVAVLRPGIDRPWYVWRATAPFALGSYFTLGSTPRGSEEPNIDRAAWNAGGVLTIMDDYWVSGSAPSPTVTLSTTSAASVLGP
jgi:hypothetical protein